MKVSEKGSPTASPDDAREQHSDIADDRWEQARTLDGLLLVLLDEAEVVATLRACAIDEAALKRTLAARLVAASRASRPATARSSIWHLIDFRRSKSLPAAMPRSTCLSVERVIARAKLVALQSDGRVVGGNDLLLSILAETASEVAALLAAEGLTRYDATWFISHGLAKGVPDRSSVPDTCAPGAAWAVLLLNDNFTPMEFVVKVLGKVFGLPPDDAMQVMLRVHEGGSAIIGTYDHANALAKAEEVTNFGRDHQFPLRCVVTDASPEREGAHAELLT